MKINQRQSSRRIELGRLGEDLALQYLVDLGMELIERNWRCRAGEIDLVLSDHDETVMCEVKTRSGSGYGMPLEAITAAKQARLRALGAAWLSANPDFRGRRIRLDAVGVLVRQPARPNLQYVRGLETW